MFGMDWYTIIFLGIIALVCFGIRKRNDRVPYDPTIKNHIKTINHDPLHPCGNPLHPFGDPLLNPHEPLNPRFLSGEEY